MHCACSLGYVCLEVIALFLDTMGSVLLGKVCKCVTAA
jgi:hypothetical protein